MQDKYMYIQYIMLLALLIVNSKLKNILYYIPNIIKILYFIYILQVDTKFYNFYEHYKIEYRSV